MESTALQQAFDTCQNNKAAWLQRKNELVRITVKEIGE